MTDRSGAPESSPSVPVIFYLFADRIVPKHPMLVEGTSIPCTEVRVQKGALAVRLLSSAFWSLRQQGVIQIEVAESRAARRMLRRPDVRVAPLKRAERPGLEGTVLASLEDRETVHDVVCRWSELGSTDPWHDVIAEVVREAVASGLIREVEAAGGVLTKLLGDSVGLEPDCDRITALEPRFRQLDSSWVEFQGREKALHDGLTGQCKRSLVACTERWYA
jgi:hypothetical protein